MAWGAACLHPAWYLVLLPGCRKSCNDALQAPGAGEPLRLRLQASYSLRCLCCITCTRCAAAGRRSLARLRQGRGSTGQVGLAGRQAGKSSCGGLRCGGHCWRADKQPWRRQQGGCTCGHCSARLTIICAKPCRQRSMLPPPLLLPWAMLSLPLPTLLLHASSRCGSSRASTSTSVDASCSAAPAGSCRPK